GSSCPGSTSGRARSGSAASYSWTTRSPGSGRCTATTSTATRGTKNGTRSQAMEELDLTDRRLLNALQGSFQLVERPFAAVADQLGLPEDEVLERTRRLRDAGVLRHLSPIFDVFRIGYKSALIAAAVDPARIEQAAAVISAHPGVSHNYAREHRFNLWFVLAIPRERDFEGTVRELAEAARAEQFLVLPAIKLFKIAVEYDMVEKITDSKPKQRPHGTRPRRELTDRDKEIIRVCQDDLPIVS